MIKHRKCVAGIVALAATGGAVAGMVFGPVAAMAEEGSTTATTATAAVAAAQTAPAAGRATTAADRPARLTKPGPASTAATVLGMSEADVRTALQSGKSLAQVAADKGVAVQKVIDAIVAADTKAIDQAVTNGKLTQAQADTRKANLVAHVTEHVNRVGMPGKGGPGGPGRGHGFARHNMGVAADVLGLSEADVRTALQSGKSLAQVAADKGVAVQKVIDAIVAADTKAIDQAVTNGKLTQAQADTRKANLVAHVTEHVNRVGVPRKGGPGGPGRGHGSQPGGPPPADATAPAPAA